MAEENKDGFQWFILHTYSGREKSVKKEVEDIVHTLGKEDIVDRVVIATTKETKKRIDRKTKKETTIEVDRIVLSGYVFLHMKKDDALIDALSKITGVSGFLGAGFKLTPASDMEVKRFLKEDNRAVSKKRISLDFRPGDRVRIIEGIFNGSDGTVESIDAEHSKITVSISVFGRETPTEFFAGQVEKFS